MKYGETLHQRSTPEWAYHNIDYDDIKLLIKEHTTPGKGKAISVPGQGNEVEEQFEALVFGVLREQDARLTLFVRSKTGEIGRRLDLCEKQIQRLQPTEPGLPPTRLRLERIARVERDAINIGDEIKSLSRFIGANRLAFGKLTKKYRKWTGSETLSDRVRYDILGRDSSFSKVDVAPLLDRWIGILQQVRASRGVPVTSSKPLKTIISESPASKPAALHSPRRNSTIIAQEIGNVGQQGSELDFDVILANTPLGDAGRKVTYWVHPEQVIELQVLLLQYLRPLRTASVGSHTASGTASPYSTLRRSSSTHTPVEGQGNSGVVFLDDVEEFARHSSQATVSDVESDVTHDTASATASIRWTIGDDYAAVAMHDRADLGFIKTPTSRIKRKNLGALIDVDNKQYSWRRKTDRASSVSSGNSPSESITNRQDLDKIRDQFEKHRQIKPMVAISHRRSRYVDLKESLGSGQWCVVDTDIFARKASVEDARNMKDWPARYYGSANRFPFAVVEIRQEGKVAQDLIDILDKSHLTERVRGFSLATHAVWDVLKPRGMSTPFWVPELSRDIRKLPEANQKPRRKGSAAGSTTASSSVQPMISNCTSTTSEAAVPSSNATQVDDMSPTSHPPTPQLAAMSDSQKQVKILPDTANPRRPKRPGKLSQRYWSEYDHPEEASGDENAYYIYVDPTAHEEYPGRAMFNSIANGFRSLFGQKKRKTIENHATAESILADEEQGLLSPSQTLADNNGTGTDSDSSSTASLRHSNRRGNGQRKQKKHRFSLKGTKTRPTNYGSILPSSSARSHNTNNSNNLLSTSSILAAATTPPPPYSLSGNRVTDLSLASSLTILTILSFLVAVSRRKARDEVDVGIILGITMVLVFLAIGVLSWFRDLSWFGGGGGADWSGNDYAEGAVAGEDDEEGSAGMMTTRRISRKRRRDGNELRRRTSNVSWCRRCIVGFVVLAECAACGVLLGWVLGGLG